MLAGTGAILRLIILVLNAAYAFNTIVGILIL